MGRSPATTAASEWATRQEDRNRLWHACHQVPYASINLVPDRKAISTDVCVPISRLAEAITGTQDDIAASGLIAPIVGHGRRQLPCGDPHPPRQA